MPRYIASAESQNAHQKDALSAPRFSNDNMPFALVYRKKNLVYWADRTAFGRKFNTDGLQFEHTN